MTDIYCPTYLHPSLFDGSLRAHDRGEGPHHVELLPTHPIHTHGTVGRNHSAVRSQDAPIVPAIRTAAEEDPGGLASFSPLGQHLSRTLLTLTAPAPHAAAAGHSPSASQQDAGHLLAPSSTPPWGGVPSGHQALPPDSGDRFIPSRAAAARLLEGDSLYDRAQAATEQTARADGQESGNSPYVQLLQGQLLDHSSASALLDRGTTPRYRDADLPSRPAKRVLRFRGGTRASIAGALDEPVLSTSPPLRTTAAACKHARRTIPKLPIKVLDAPGLQDDFYLNLVDWSRHNVLAVGLGSAVYLWCARTAKVVLLCEYPGENIVCSVAWNHSGTYLSVGTLVGDVDIWDVSSLKLVRRFVGHRGRVGVLSWSSHLLSSGSRDRSILQMDIRAPEDFQHRLLGHRSEVCGLRWSPNGRELASGSNDDKLCIWSLHSTSPVLTFSDHKAAVKAIAWSPHKEGLLASGGGTKDRCIRFWSTATGSLLSSTNTGSQVCNLLWSKNVNEIVSSHGYSQYQIVVWNQPTMTKMATLQGHTQRALYLAASPDGQTVVTGAGAGDETLRLWNIFPPAPRTKERVRETAAGCMMRSIIR